MSGPSQVKRSTSCDHGDVRYVADSHGAVACFDCGRLFGHLRPDDTFAPHNPGPPPHHHEYVAGRCVVCGFVSEAPSSYVSPRSPFGI